MAAEESGARGLAGGEEGTAAAAAANGDRSEDATPTADAPDASAALASSSAADDRSLPRASTMPGVIKNEEITNEPPGPSNLERSRTERRRQNNPADDPSKQLFDDKIPIKKKVAKSSATSKEEWEEQCKLWPTSYHPAHDLDIRGCREDELPSIFNWMKTAIQLSKEGNATIIVDPSSNQIIAKAKDQTHHHDTAAEGNKIPEVKAEGTCSLNESTQKDGKLFVSGSYLSIYNSLSMEVSCMNPWGWTKQKTSGLEPLSCQGCFAWHPLCHAAMVAIEKAAERDRMLFTSSTTVTKSILNGHLEIDSDNEPAKRLKTDAKDKEQSTNGACCGDSSQTTRPYLCTGFDIYLVWEPCAMCAMALVHQRFKRVFYIFPNPITGALGRVYRLHGEKSLNHHYTVFRISVPESYLNSLTEC